MFSFFYPKIKLRGLVDDFIYNTLDVVEYEVIDIPSVKLLTWNRLDLGFKLFYLDMLKYNKKLAIQVYEHDIRSQTLGSFKEYGNNNKISFKKYIDDFQYIYSRIKKNGFDEQESLIPLSECDTIINGAHRVATAIKLKKNIRCVRLDKPVMTCDYKYFYERNVPSEILEMAVNKFIEYSDSCYIAFLWPSGKADRLKAEEHFTDIVYKKEINFSFKGAFNLIVELYKHMDWLGKSKTGFSGAKQKLLECFPSLDSVMVIVFQADTLEKVRNIKNSVRNIYNIGFSSIHITDTKEEAVRISRLIFNKNSIHFLNYAEPYKFFPSQVMTGFSHFLERNKISKEDVLIDSSIVLSLYGLRKPKDIDFLILDNDRLTESDLNFENHDSELVYHRNKKNDLIYNPNFYFYYSGFKFVSFAQLYKMKSNRNEEKDKNDCRLMGALVEDNKWAKTVAGIKQAFFYSKIKVHKEIREAACVFLKATGLYVPARWIYRNLKGRL